MTPTIAEPTAPRYAVTPPGLRESYVYRRYELLEPREGEALYGIEVRESGAGMLVELWGEFDLFSLDSLRKTLNNVLDLHRPTLVDLSGITFLDLNSARELAVRAQLCAHHLFLKNPSPWVTASLEAFGLGGWIPFHPGTDHEEPPLVSGASQ